jgi:endonuclease YncB( thermonuclease family)
MAFERRSTMETPACRRTAVLVVMVLVFAGHRLLLAQPQHPLAAHKVHVHQAIHTHRQNVGGALQTHRQNVGGAIQTHHQNVVDHRQNIAARRILPPYQPATITPAGAIALPLTTTELPPSISIAPPSITVQAPPSPAPPTPGATPSVPPSTPVQPPSPAAQPGLPPAPGNGAAAAEAAEDEGLDSDPDENPFEGSKSYEVVRIEDGGITVVLKVGEGETKVRMIGVTSVRLGQNANLPDRPERRMPSTEGYLENLLKGESVYVVYDSQVAEQDADGKCVAYLCRAPDGLMVNQEAIRAGFAVADTSYDFDQKTAFTAYQESAKKAERGIYRIVQRIKARRAATQNRG